MTMAAAAAAAAAGAAAALISSNRNPTPKINYRISHFRPAPFPIPSLLPPLSLTRRRFSPLHAALQEIAVEVENKTKLYAVNLPWSLTAADFEKLFGECGTVKDVEIIKQKSGKSRGFAFITMGTEEEAQAAVKKFDSFELMGRIIRVEFARKFRKPSPPAPPPSSAKSAERYKIYASNLSWKVRSTNLKDFFSEKFKPVSTRVVFDNPSGRSAGYGFVGFATLEEAETAVSELDGKELMGRPLRLKISQRTGDESGEEPEADDAEQEPEAGDESREEPEADDAEQQSEGS